MKRVIEITEIEKGFELSNSELSHLLGGYTTEQDGPLEACSCRCTNNTANLCTTNNKAQETIK